MTYAINFWVPDKQVCVNETYIN